jgi:UDP-N-acetylglucosamine--N-acetylmuramyl-(pentapeptide) pyrophosphoryl-undecaprenol N-acetylglucosamine transferase
VRTLLVATIGGHLVELVEIARRLPPEGEDVRVWVTQDHPQSRSLLADEEHVVYVPDVHTKDVLGVVRVAPIAYRLQREWQFDRVISTGSATALSFLPYLVARGVDAHYIECATRVVDASITGRILQHVPRVQMHTQWKHLVNGRWHYAGSVFDGFVGVPRETDGVIRRAVVSLGTMPDFQFRRLLETLAPLLGPAGVLEQKQGAPVHTLWQTGSTPSAGLGIDTRPFVPAAELACAISEADVVVTHAGTGSSLTALNADKFPLLVPRDDARGEIGDGHQVLFARELDQRGVALHRDADDLDVDDLIFAANHAVKRAAEPPLFQL